MSRGNYQQDDDALLDCYGEMEGEEIMSNELKKVQEFFSAPETPNQLAWGYAHMAMHHILTSNDDVDLGITPQSTLLEVAEVAHKHGVSLDFNTRPNEWKAVSEELPAINLHVSINSKFGEIGRWDGKQWFVANWYRKEWYPSDNVTHWMPLPQPPK